MAIWRQVSSLTYAAAGSVKVNFTLWTPWRPVGMKVYLHSFLTSVLDEGKWTPSCPWCCTPAERAHFTFRIVGGCSREGETFPCPPQPWHYTDCTTQHLWGTEITEFYEVVLLNKPITLWQCLPSCLLQGTQTVANSWVCFVLYIYIYIYIYFGTLDDRRFLKVTELLSQISVSLIPSRRWDQRSRPLDVLKILCYYTLMT